ncbi:MAG TPA: penicillin-binding transpeptidase domain-containing protein [Terriglobales bacterium]|nr:penicillin-binding transpeptidase domain-containing protein [Terriglobales bacterium]
MTAKSSTRALVVFVATLALLTHAGFAATISNHTLTPNRKPRAVKESRHARRHMRHLARSRRVRSRTVHALKKHHYYERFYASSYSNDITDGDKTAGEDPVVRQAAIDALGNMNGTVLAIEPTSGRILAMVNQKLALSSGAQPCSTIKLSVALAALSEGIITKETEVRLGGRSHMNLTLALAHSNNAYFEALGRQLGFEKVARYAHLFGLGQLAGYHVAGEQPGVYPEEEISPKLGGVGKMCSFGEGISMTPLQLGALVTAISNGGTMYYLQHPTTAAAVANFQPMVRRHLNIGGLIPEISDGMAGAVEFGTARRVLLNFNEEEVLGKTGTCSRAGTRFGWFASYANTDFGRVVVVVFLEGGRPTFGPKAAEIAGRMYHNLYSHDFFLAKPIVPSPAVLPSAPESSSSD